MTTLCSVCEKTLSKYKCPACQIPYCSITCFKAHKQTALHERNSAKTSGPSANTNETTATLPAPPEHSAPTDAPPAPTPAPMHLVDEDEQHLAALRASPQLAHLLTTHPALKARLRRIYDATLEPDSEDESSERQRSWQPSRGRGRGRGPWRGPSGADGWRGRVRGRGYGYGYGRGRGRGAAGGWDRAMQGAWSQDKADRVAVDKVRVERERGGEEMGEFVALVMEFCADKEVAEGEGEEGLMEGL